MLCAACTNSAFYHSQENIAIHCKLPVNIAFKDSVAVVPNNVAHWTVRSTFPACERIKDLVMENFYYSYKFWETVEPFNRAKVVTGWFLQGWKRLGCQPGMCGSLGAVPRHHIPVLPELLLLAQGCTWDLWELLLGSGASSLSAASPLLQPSFPICNLQKLSELPGTKISANIN